MKVTSGMWVVGVSVGTIREFICLAVVWRIHNCANKPCTYRRVLVTIVAVEKQYI